MSVFRRALTSIAAVIAIASASSSANAAVVYSNLGPGDSYYDRSGWALSDWRPQDAAMPFSAGADFTFTSVEMALSGSVGSLVVSLRSDVGGLPGSIIESFTIPVQPLPALVTVTSVDNPLLTSGTTYWISAEAISGFDGAWMHTSPVDIGPIAFSFSNGSTWTPITTQRGAFRVNGDLVNDIPEPAGWVLLATGLAAAGAARRRHS